MLLDEVLPVIGDFLTGFQRNPESFAEDTDARRELFSELYRHFSRLDRKLSIPRADLSMGYYPDRAFATLTPVKTAYPAEFQFDIAILDTESPRPPSAIYTASDTKYQRYWQQKVALAVQIHLCKPEQDAMKYFKKLRSDLEKFEMYTREHNDHFTGLSLLLVQGDFPDPNHLPTSSHFRIHPGNMPDATGIFARIIAENGIYGLLGIQ